jgi:hypothetical protein
MTAVAHDHQGDKPEGTPRSHLLAQVPPPRDPADSERPQPSEPMPVRDAIAEYIAKACRRRAAAARRRAAHLAALLTDITDEA